MGSGPNERVVVWIPYGEPGWELQPAHPDDSPWIGGGIRTVHELAVAIACTGRTVELRGAISPEVVTELADAAGARPELPDQPRLPTAADTVIVPEGIREPLVHGRLALSPARTVLAVLGPPGLIGWSFTSGWSPPDPLTVDVESLGRPDGFRAASALGYELWTNSPGLQRAAEAAGVSCRFLGSGQPASFPAPPPVKDIDVLALADNRWAPLARGVVQELERRGVECVTAQSAGHADLLELFGRSRVLIHPSRVEGRSRIGREARAMGAVPVVLDSDPFAVDLDEGVIAVRSVAEMPDAVSALLADRGRLERLAAAAMSAARAEVEWEPYLRRVSAALDDRAEVPGLEARAEIGTAMRTTDAESTATADEALRRVEARAADLGRAEERAAALGRDLAGAEERIVALAEELAGARQRAAAAEEAAAQARAELDLHRAWLASVNGSLSWRLTAPLRSAKRRLTPSRRG
jgi:hypothetical protein